jgi:uncharacterized protein (UPF0332 family)
MKEFIKLYEREGLIKQEKIGFDQVIKHINRARKDLRVSEVNLKIDAEAAYNYAYLAMLRTGRALMLSYGYRPVDGEQHKTVVSFCEHILGLEFSELVRRFDRMRKKRNRFTYDEPGLLVSETETSNAFKNAKQFVEKVSRFIQVRNSQQKLL